MSERSKRKGREIDGVKEVERRKRRKKERKNNCVNTLDIRRSSLRKNITIRRLVSTVWLPHGNLRSGRAGAPTAKKYII